MSLELKGFPAASEKYNETLDYWILYVHIK